MNFIESVVSSTLFSGRSSVPSGRRKTKDRITAETPEPIDEEGVFLSPSRVGTEIKRTPRQIPLMEGEVRPQETIKCPWDQVPAIEGMDRLPPAIPESPGRITIIGQLDRSYILCEIGQDLLLIDQHAAHERIRFEMIKSKRSGDKAVIQELLDPIQVEMDGRSMENLEMIADELEALGFVLEPFGTDMVTVRGLPRFMGRTEGHDVLKDMLTGNEHHEGCSYPDDSFRIELPMKERLIALSACRGAIKAHQRLSLREMEDLIRDLMECEVPLHCAHGRPTMVRLPLRMLEKWFRRIL
jgi:DNA mismatch repair protein MutL